MPLLQVEAEKLSETSTERGIIEEIIDKDDMFAILPFMKIDGKAYLYNREKTLSEAQFITPVDSQVPEGAADFDEVTARLRILAGQVRVDRFLDETDSDLNNQKAIQIAAKAKGLNRKFRRTLARGDSANNPAEFDGIDKMATAAQTITAGVNGNPLTYEAMDELLDSVPLGADVIIMREGTVRAYRSLLRSAGGLEPAMVMMENFGRPMLTHNGVPIIVNEFLNPAETVGTNDNTTSVYAARFNEADGIHGLVGGNTLGVRLDDLGIHADYDSTTMRMVFYTGLCQKATHSLGRLEGITNV